MNAFWTYAAVGGLVMSLSGAAFADCAGKHRGQTVQVDVPETVASGPAPTAPRGDKR